MTFQLRRGTEAQRKASSTVHPAGALVLTDEGQAYTADGTTPAKSLKRHIHADDQIIDARDWGVIGDATSRPLSGLFGSLAAAQAVYPSAIALTDELDWAAAESCAVANPGKTILVHKSLHMITNRPIDPQDSTVWQVDGIIENNWPRNSPTAFQDRANVFRFGNAHPAMVQVGSGFDWPVFALGSISNGDRIVTVTTPSSIAGGGYSINVGDKVIVRSDTNPDPTGATGVTYDWEQINKVLAWNSSTGALTLERPLKATCPNITTAPSSGAGGAPATPAAPTLGAVTALGKFAAGTYTWKVTAIDSLGRESAASPASSSATLSANAAQTVFWASVTNATNYRLYRSDGTNTVLVAFTTALSIVDIGVPLTLSNPKLLINSGVPDSSNGQPWHFADGVKLFGKGKLIGGSPFGYKVGMWRCEVNIECDTQDLASVQACVDCDITIHGQFTDRLLEVKMVALDSRFHIFGTYKPDATITPFTTVSIGEQTSSCDFDLTMHRGPEHTANVRALEVFAQDIKLRARIHDFSTGGQVEVVAVKSTGNNGRPPSDIDLDLYVRAVTGRSQYLLIGNDANGDGNANDADPVRVRWRVNGRIPDGALPIYVANVARGTELEQLDTKGDARRVNVVNPAEVPERAPYVLAVISGAVTYAAGDALLGSYTLTGCKVGDRVDVSMQQFGIPTSGTFGDLYVTATVAAANSVRVYIRNRSATSVVFPTGTVFWLQATWQRARV